jgi:hypothetical protein
MQPLLSDNTSNLLEDNNINEDPNHSFNKNKYNDLMISEGDRFSSNNVFEFDKSFSPEKNRKTEEMMPSIDFVKDKKSKSNLPLLKSKVNKTKSYDLFN